MPKYPTWVVKLGGSLVGSAALHAWLATLGGVSHRARIIVVAGGGPFADAVRHAQPGLGISDPTAHAMAVLGMRQFALAIDALIPGATAGLISADSLLTRDDAAGLMVWDPADPALVTSGIPEDWTATSDSIAAWLGGRIGASGTVLVKSRAAVCGTGLASALAAEGFVDECLSEILRAGEQALWWLECSATGEFLRLVDGAALPEYAIRSSVSR